MRVERKPDSTIEQVLNKFKLLSKDDKIEVLEEALLKMSKKLESVDHCKALAMGYTYNEAKNNWNKV